MCAQILEPGACAACLESACCAELAACDEAPSCLACVLGAQTNPALCDAEPTHAAALAFTGCLAAHCDALCTPAQCNPITNAGCDAAAGEACDLASAGFRCFPPPNEQALCAPCDANVGPFCAPGMHCLKDGACARYCCDDADCGAGLCDRALLGHPLVGVCLRAD